MGLNESEYPGEQPKSSDLMLAMKDASDSEARNELEEERRLFQLMKTLNIGLKMGGLQRQEKQTVASRFVFEASITDSVVVGKALDNGDRPELKKSMSKLYKWYLQEFDKLAV